MSRFAVASAAALVSVVSLTLPAAPAGAADTASLDVVRVEGREIELLMGLDPTVEVPKDADVTATMEVSGMTFPATSALLTGEEQARTAMLALDVSGSMAAERLSAAKSAARAFIGALPEDVNVGLIAFNGVAQVVEPPTSNRVRVLRQVDRLVAAGDTSLYDAVVAGVAAVGASDRPHVIVLSDGADTSSQARLTEAVRAATDASVVIDVIGIAPDARQRRVLATLTDATGGRLLAASGTGDLVAAFDEASLAFGPSIRLTGSVPEGVDGQGGLLTASVSAGGRVIEQSVSLPETPSLGVAVPQRSAVVPTAVVGTSTPSVPADRLVWPLVLAAVMALAVLIGVLVIADRHRIRRDRGRARQVLDYGIANTATDRRGADHLATMAAMSALDARLASSAWARGAKTALAAGEVRLSPVSWTAVRLGLASGVGVIGLIIGPIGLVAGVALGWFGSSTWLRIRSRRRQRAFADELPDFLLLLASSLRAGLSFTHALETTARDGRGEVGRQMRRVMHEVQVGATLDEALTECAERMCSEDLHWVVTALSIQQEVGGTLSDVLDAAAATIKTRWELQREVRTLSAEGRISAYVLIALPVGMWLFLYATRREYLQLLWTVPIGVVMLIGMVALIGVGIVWMRSVVRIEI